MGVAVGMFFAEEPEEATATVIVLPTEVTIRRRLEGKNYPEKLLRQLGLKLANQVLIPEEVASRVHWCVAAQPRGSVAMTCGERIIDVLMPMGELRQKALAELEWLQERMLDQLFTTGKMDICQKLRLSES